MLSAQHEGEAAPKRERTGALVIADTAVRRRRALRQGHRGGGRGVGATTFSRLGQRLAGGSWGVLTLPAARSLRPERGVRFG